MSLDATSRTCRTCGVKKPLLDFYKKRNACRSCERARNKVWAKANPEKRREITQRHLNRLGKAGRQIKHAKWCRENRAKRNESARRWRAANPDKIRGINTANYWSMTLEQKERKREKDRCWRHSSYRSSPKFNLTMRMRARISLGLSAAAKRKGSSAARIKKACASENLLGASFDEVFQAITARLLPGMEWGERTKWHLDHVVPLARFNLEDTFHQMAAFHHLNLEPVWATQNISKGCKLTKETRDKQTSRLRDCGHSGMAALIESLPLTA